MDPDRIAESIRLLEENHDFPCEFVFKIIGQNTEVFVEEVLSVMRSTHPCFEPRFQTRQTPNGRHISITVEPVMPSAVEVLEIYRQLQEIDGVVMIM